METKYDARVLRKDQILASWGKKYPEGNEKLCKEGSEPKGLALPKGVSGWRVEKGPAIGTGDSCNDLGWMVAPKQEMEI